jgi:hypothetical protein
MELTLMNENEDGSADFDLTISPLEVQALVNLGLISVLKQAIEEGKQYVPTSKSSVDDTGCGESSCSYGPCVKSGKPEQPCYCSETTQVPY